MSVKDLKFQKKSSKFDNTTMEQKFKDLLKNMVLLKVNLSILFLI